MEGIHVASYKGKRIYKSEGFLLDEYWYVSGSKMIYCEPVNEDDYSQGWVDTLRLYLKKQ